MFLERLQILNNEEIIRDIEFHKGINLIIDNTPSENKKKSGNSVGKTTVLRLIDFCLDGKGENIYIDPEFKNANTKIRNFLTENNIIIKLVMVESLDNITSKKITIERNFLKYKEKIQRINGEDYSNDDFSAKLKKEIFNYEKSKPTLKQLKSKNIRDEKNKLLNTIRVLNPYTTDVEYELLMFFWLGIETYNSKDKLVKEKNLEEKLQTRLRNESNLSEITQKLYVINDQINEAERRKLNFNINENFDNDLSRLNVITSTISEKSSKLARFSLRKELIIESRDELDSDIAEIDVEQIRKLYDKAKKLIPSIQRTFEDTLSFHNKMIEKKKSYISEELPNIEGEIKTLNSDISNLFNEEKRLKHKLNESQTIEDLQKLVENLNRLYEQKGALEEQKSLWEKSNKKLNRIKNDLNTINTEITSRDDMIQKRISEFNKFFSSISSRLDGVHSILSADNDDNVYKFKIDNIEGNPGTGSKKSQMASFDLAYIEFASEYDIPCLHFILQDQIENVHSNQITILLTDIVNEVNCQYILPVLKDKLPQEIDIKEMETLSLSPDEKLFKLQ